MQLPEVYVGASSLSQGVETVMTQIAADALEVPMERIPIFHGLTNYLKEGWGSFGTPALLALVQDRHDALDILDLMSRFGSSAGGAFPQEVEQRFVQILGSEQKR